MENLKLSQLEIEKLDLILSKLSRDFSISELQLANSNGRVTGCAGNCKGSCVNLCGGCGGDCKGSFRICGIF